MSDALTEKELDNLFEQGLGDEPISPKDIFPIRSWKQYRRFDVRLVATIRRIRAERDLFANGIRHVRDQRGDDRCWVDLVHLYQLLPEGWPCEALQLMPVEEGLKYCRAYLESFHHPQLPYISPRREIERLRSMLERLVSALEISAKPKGTAVRALVLEAKAELAPKHGMPS